MQNILADINKICRFSCKKCRYFVVFRRVVTRFQPAHMTIFPAVYPVLLPQAVVRLAWLRCRSAVSLILQACVIRGATCPASDRPRRCPGSRPASSRILSAAVAMGPESWPFSARRGGLLSAALIDCPPLLLASSLRPSKLRRFRGRRGCPGNLSGCTCPAPQACEFRALVNIRPGGGPAMQSGCTRPAAVAGWPWVRNPDLVCPGFARIRTRPIACTSPAA